LLPCRTVSRYTTRFVPIPLNAVLSKHSNPTAKFQCLQTLATAYREVWRISWGRNKNLH
jgi:hypothetical protein